MRRRIAPEPVTDDGTPKWIADGPVIGRWAADAHLETVEALASARLSDTVDSPATTATRRQAEDAAMISAAVNYSRAVHAWARENDRDFRDVKVNTRPHW